MLCRIVVALTIAALASLSGCGTTHRTVVVPAGSTVVVPPS